MRFSSHAVRQFSALGFRSYSGKRLQHPDFSDSFQAVHSFWIAAVDRPILGADFFAAHHLLIDMNHRRLLGPSGLVLPASASRPASVCGLRLPMEGAYKKILEEFPELLSQNFSGSVKHNVRHYIPTEGPPIHSRPRRLDGDKLQVAQVRWFLAALRGLQKIECGY